VTTRSTVDRLHDQLCGWRSEHRVPARTHNPLVPAGASRGSAVVRRRGRVSCRTHGPRGRSAVRVPRAGRVGCSFPPRWHPGPPSARHPRHREPAEQVAARADGVRVVVFKRCRRWPACQFGALTADRAFASADSPYRGAVSSSQSRIDSSCCPRTGGASWCLRVRGAPSGDSCRTRQGPDRRRLLRDQLTASIIETTAHSLQKDIARSILVRANGGPETQIAHHLGATVPRSNYRLSRRSYSR